MLTKLYWVLHGMIDFCLCPSCNQTKLEKNVDSFEKGYFRACSTQCAAANPERTRKYEATMMKNYGSTNFFTSEAGKKKQQDWCEKNGVSNAFQLQSVKDKAAATRKKNFGYEYTMQSPEKRKLTSENYKKKTGYDHQFENPEVIAKSMATKQEKKEAGIDVYAKNKQTNRMKRYQKFLQNVEVQPLFTAEEFAALNGHTQYTTLLRWRCLRCGSVFEAYIDPNFSSRESIPVRCLKCHPFSIVCGTSKMENELQDFINSFGFEVQCNTKKVISPLEIDAYIPQKNIAFEFDGLYWHSEKKKDFSDDFKYYHLAKTEMCESKGIHLVHIFEDEWLEKRAIAESRIKNLLGIFDLTVFARKCHVQEVDSATARTFLEANHIQGVVIAKVNLGLFAGEELVSLMTFSAPRFTKKFEWELLRFCNKLGYHIPGAAGKLLKYFEKNWHPKSLISYADRRWSQGNLYKALGFKLDHISKPDYWYIKDQHRMSRVQFQKHKLKDKLPVFDESLTEVQNMYSNGYSRIFDCGNFAFYKTY